MDTVTTSSEWTLRVYSPDMRREWDEFVQTSRNSTFLFRRAYLEYHADRFSDHSLLAFKRGKLRALLPANITADGTLHSHQGLTYGGWILPQAHFDSADMLLLFREWLACCRGEGIREVDYKPLPWIYASRPSQEDLYALFRCGAALTHTLISTTIDLRVNPGFNTMRRRQLRKASGVGAIYGELGDTDEFMALVAACLHERYDASPVHTPDEMRRLRAAFPENIRMFGARLDGVLQAGVMIYDTPAVAHCQYIASTPLARELNLLTPLFHKLITEWWTHKRYFDFGTSNEDGGRFLNDTLLRQKASMGGSGVAYQRFLFSTDVNL